MSWWALLRRGWAVWKLHRRKFNLCSDCSIPLTFEEAAQSGQGYNGVWRCTECKECADAKNNVPTRSNIRGSWNELHAPGLQQLFIGFQQDLINQQQAMSQQQLSLDQQCRTGLWD